MARKLSEKATQFHELCWAIEQCHTWQDIDAALARINDFHDTWAVRKTWLVLFSWTHYDSAAMDMTRQLKEKLMCRMQNLSHRGFLGCKPVKELVNGA